MTAPSINLPQSRTMGTPDHLVVFSDTGSVKAPAPPTLDPSKRPVIPTFSSAN